ncbi:hypothetical protein CXB51_034628 [Gossypium anomalum]|uniref:Uncharacterized protein n=1 Tax=Gossypium anomalum TaxID=47600 RepID=A0A8J5YA34_9ROSI|nr:hypothetical protein CXB51_034628 [Gossypium anomalum]
MSPENDPLSYTEVKASRRSSFSLPLKGVTTVVMQCNVGGHLLGLGNNPSLLSYDHRTTTAFGGRRYTQMSSFSPSFLLVGGLLPKDRKTWVHPPFLDSTMPNGEESSDDAAAGRIWQSQQGRSLPFWCKRRQGGPSLGHWTCRRGTWGARHWEKLGFCDLPKLAWVLGLLGH